MKNAFYTLKIFFMKSIFYLQINSIISTLKKIPLGIRAVLLLIFFLMTGTSTKAQDCGTINCTSNDVQITGASLKANLNGDPLGVCNSGQSVDAYLFLVLSTNTPRVGVSISGRIELKVNGELVEAFGQCFGVALSGNNTVVKFTDPVTWTCGSSIVLSDVLISWGTGNTNFCNTSYTSETPEPAKCPATKSKCWKQPPSDYIDIVTFPCSNPTINGQPLNQQECVGSSASFTVSYTDGQPPATIQWQVSTNNGGSWSNLVNNGTYSGVSTATVSVSNVTTTMNGYRYRAVLTNNTSDNQCGATTDGLATLTVYAIPSAPGVNVVDNCNGTSTLTATGATGTLLWNTGQSTATITVNSAGTYTVTQTLYAGGDFLGCTSAAGSGIANPKTTPSAPGVNVVDNCDGTSTLTATGYSGTLAWSTDPVQTSAEIIVSTAGTYYVTQTVNGCTSAAGSGIANPKSTPDKPVVIVVDNCNGTSTLSTDATGYLKWSTGMADDGKTTITVNAAGTYYVTQTVNGCISEQGSGIANPKSTPDKPVVIVVDNCNGTSTLSTEATGFLKWSTGMADDGKTTITVNAAGTYYVTQTVNGCISEQGSGITNPGNTPAAAMVTYHAPACDATTFSVEITNVAAGVTYTIKDKNGNNIPGVFPGNSVLAANNNNITFNNIPAGSGYKVTSTVGFCSSAQTECGAADPSPNRVVTQASAKEVTIELSGNQPTVVAYPNPFQTTVNFKLVSPVTGRVSLDIYNASGIRIGNAFNGVLQANVPVNTEFRLARPESGMLFYRMLGNGTSVSGKIMSVRQ
jgi:hypothetical protein